MAFSLVFVISFHVGKEDGFSASITGKVTWINGAVASCPIGYELVGIVVLVVVILISIYQYLTDNIYIPIPQYHRGSPILP